ncbi:MAG: hypothetical protein MJ152_02185 [Clostridia bacterium]|nr:hypothetical protein [Clostridia bacterium]
MIKTRHNVKTILIALALVVVTSMAIIFAGCCGKVDYNLYYDTWVPDFEYQILKVDVVVEKDKTLTFNAKDFTISVDGHTYQAKFATQWSYTGGGVTETKDTITENYTSTRMTDLDLYFPDADLYGKSISSLNLKYQGKTIKSFDSQFNG